MTRPVAPPPRPPTFDDPSRYGRRRPGWVSALVFTVFASLLWFGLLSWLTPEVFQIELIAPDAPRASQRTRELREAIPAIDTAIAGTLESRAPGVVPLSHKEQLETLHGVNWRSSITELQLPATAQADAVVGALHALRFPTGWEVRIDDIALETLSPTLQVTVHGFPTHLLTFHPTLPQTLPIDLEPDRPIRIALLIDGAGESREVLDPLWGLEAPFAVSIRPFTPHALSIAQEAYTRRKEILVHLPIEASPGAGTTLGALRRDMSQADIRQQTKRLVRAIPYAVGADNRQGSAFSRDDARMRPVLEVLKAEHMFYVDSRTLGEAPGYRLAKSIGVAAAERQVFLDNDPAPEAVRRALGRLKAVAVQRGQALGIGHPNAATIEVLAEWLPETAAEGFQIVPVSAVLE